jgi:multiple antibiotic resistance protein
MLRRGEQFGEGPPDKKLSPSDMSLVPLALPSLSGPGAITVTIVSMKIPDFNWWIMIIIVVVSILLTMLITYVIFMGSVIIIKLLGKKGMDAFTRVMGLLTVAIAVQFALTGFSEWISTISF